MKLTVVVPVFNVERYLRDCLDSLLNQTFKNFDIVCVNDASVDSSAEILDEYAKKDCRLKVVTKVKNQGLGYARNTGLENSESDYVIFLDSDDYLKEDLEDILYIYHQK